MQSQKKYFLCCCILVTLHIMYVHSYNVLDKCFGTYMCVYIFEFNEYVEVNAILSIDESDITENSATLTCELSCFSPNLQCTMSDLTTNNTNVNVAGGSGQVTGSVTAYSYPTQNITLYCLTSGTTYNYCVIATNTTNMVQVGEPVCGSFTTNIITSDRSDGMYIAKYI